MSNAIENSTHDCFDIATCYSTTKSKNTLYSIKVKRYEYTHYIQFGDKKVLFTYRQFLYLTKTRSQKIQEVADELGISKRTLDSYLMDIKRKMKPHGVCDLDYLAIHIQEVTPEMCRVIPNE